MRRGHRHRTRTWHLALAALTLGLAYQQAREHPAAAVAAVGALTLLTAAAWQVRRRWRLRAGQRTVLYRHYFHDGTPLYYGITNSYRDRCGQHGDDSWWWFYVDPTRSTNQTWPNRQAALRAETAAIRRDRPIGNTRDNPAWAVQQPRRRQLQERAAAAQGYAQPPPTITIPGPRSRRHAGRFA